MAEMFVDKTAAALMKTLEGTTRRQHALAENVANAETPGYTRKDVQFEGQLREVLSRPDLQPGGPVAEIEGLAIEEKEDVQAPRRANGCNVDMEREMVALAKNSLEFETAAQFMSLRFRALRSAISEGKR
ncbi:MAG: flagellar basal body rod protein FlgB [Armatimonadota bacterium]